MTLITLQDSKVVLRDGKVGTEQACCCEQVCNEFIGAGCDFTDTCEDLYETEQEAQDRADIFVSNFFAWANSIDIEGALVAAGYSNVSVSGNSYVYSIEPEPPQEFACGVDPYLILWSWGGAVAYAGECCGDRFIDYEAEPTVLWDPNGLYGPIVDGPDYPPVTPTGTCDALEEVVIYPCVDNPLP
jgi:hypothetical protein